MAKRFYLDDAPPIAEQLNPFKYTEYNAGTLEPVVIAANRTPDYLSGNKPPVYNKVADSILDFLAPGLTDILRVGDEENRYQKFKKALNNNDRREALSYVNMPTPEERQRRLPTEEEKADPNYWARQPELIRFVHRYRTEGRPYSKKLDWRNTTNSEGAPIALSRLGEFGMRQKRDMIGRINPTDYTNWEMIDPERITNYNNKEYKQYVKECARFANLWNRHIGKSTTGDAWTRKGIFGDSIVFNKQQLENTNIQTVKDKVQTGDIVDLTGTKEHMPGRGNSHTGNIYKPLGSDGPTYIVHNINGTVKVDPIETVAQGHLWNPLRITRPAPKPQNDFVLDESDPTYKYTTRYNPATGTKSKIYTAIPNDSPWRIAHNHGMTLDQFYKLNPQARKGVYVGFQYNV